MSNVIWVETKEELVDILDSNDVVVVDFSAPDWCVPCQKFAPVFDAVSERSTATFVAVDIDRAPWAMLDYGVQSVPTVVVYKNGGFEKYVARTPAERTPLQFMSDINV